MQNESLDEFRFKVAVLDTEIGIRTEFRPRGTDQNSEYGILPGF